MLLCINHLELGEAMNLEEFLFGEIEENIREQIYALVIYDISNDRRRSKLAKMLSGYGNRIQKSAFEVHLNKQRFKSMKMQLASFCDDKDGIRVYKLNDQCEVLKLGVDHSFESEDIVVI